MYLFIKKIFRIFWKNHSSTQNFIPFTLHKKNIYNDLSLMHLFIPIIMILVITTFAFKNNTQSSNTISSGDSLLTELILEKEMAKVSNGKMIQTKEDLEQLSQIKPLSFAFYRIRPGENLSSVAEKFGLSMATILSLNSLDNAHSLSVGQKVLLSTRSGIIFNSTNDESLQSIAKRYGISEQETLLVNDLSKNEIQAGETLFLPDANLSFKAMAEILGFQFINPVPRYHRVSSHFGWRRHPILRTRKLHAGIDFAAPTGTPIVAAKEGRVIYADWNGGYGLVVRIRHNNGLTTTYAHMSKIRTSNGTWVKAGERIGDVGSTGRSTGSHLHFEVRKYGQPKNPVYNGLQL